PFSRTFNLRLVFFVSCNGNSVRKITIGSYCRKIILPPNLGIFCFLQQIEKQFFLNFNGVFQKKVYLMEPFLQKPRSNGIYYGDWHIFLLSLCYKNSDFIITIFPFLKRCFLNGSSEKF